QGYGENQRNAGEAARQKKARARRSPQSSGSNADPHPPTRPKPTARGAFLRSVVGEHRPAFGAGGLANGGGIQKSAGPTPGARPEICTLHPLHVVPGLPERGDAVSAVDGPLSRIVRRKGQLQITIVAFQQRLEVTNPGVDVLLRA